MLRPTLVTLLLGLPIAATAADDLRVSQLEQDVRDLQRQIQVLSRQLESQRLSPPAAGANELRDSPKGTTTPVATPAWLDAAKWQRVQPGMGELEVLGILGPPTSTRMQEGMRVLLYALEIGSSAYLSGSISLRDRSVISVQKPVLK